MSNRVLRAGLFGIPLIAMGMAFVAACADDTEDPNGSPDASPDVPLIDSSAARDGNTGSDAQKDATTINDAGTDSQGDADADAPVLPPLCQTYPNVDWPTDAGFEPEMLNRWDLIAFRAVSGAIDACEINAAFQAPDDLPVQFDCFGKQLAGLVGCVGATDYATASDGNGEFCAPATGEKVQLGFRNPDAVTYHAKDVDHFITLVKQAAISTGMPAADADRLIALLQAHKNKVANSDAGGAGDGGDYSQNSCP